MLRHVIGMGFCALAFAAVVHAQDLTWTELETVADLPVPTPQVKISGRRTPPVPEEIKKLNEIAYGKVEFVTDGRGKVIARRPFATTPWLTRAMDEGLRDARVWFAPEQPKEGPYLGSQSYLIFNPPSASQKLPTSTPRAISVQSAPYPGAFLADLKKRKIPEDTLPEFAYVDISVDDQGTVTSVQTPGMEKAPLLANAAAAAAKQWKFLPGRESGKAVAAELRVPVLFSWPEVFSSSDVTKLPRVTRQTTPVYPMSERRGGFRGEVMVEFVVATDGSVRDAFVKETNNPNFNEPALQAVRQWKFQPGIHKGQPVNTRMMVPMVFELDGFPSSDRYEVSSRRPSKLPEELKNDYPPRVKNVAPGVYPFELLEKDAHATVTENFVVGPDGRVNFYDTPDQKLTEFDYAARAMIEEFEFIPASKNGKPNWGLLKMEVEFDHSSTDVPVSDSARHILRELRKKDPAIVQANQADQKPELSISRAPVYPSNLREKGIAGDATIDFFVDEEGQAQLPRIVSASHPSFGYAAAQAVSKWRFIPITREGKACIVRLRVPMKFNAVAAEEQSDATAPKT